MVVNVDGGWVVAVDTTPILVKEFIQVLTQYDPIPGSHTGDVDARLAALDAEGVHRELAFPNSVLAVFGWPDREVRELCFRLYNQHIAEVQERSGDRIYGVGLVNWWDPEGTERTLTELKALGLTTFLMPINPGRDEDKRPIDYSSTAMDPVWDVIEDAGVPASSSSARARRRRPTSSTRSPSACSSPLPRSATASASTSWAGSLTATRGCASGGSRAGSTGCRRPSRTPSTSGPRLHRRPPGGARPAALLGRAHGRLLHGRPARPGPDRPGSAPRPGAGVVDGGLPAHNESHLRAYSSESLASVVEAVGTEAAVPIVGGNIRRYLGLDS